MNMLGISPAHVVKIDAKLLEEVDGPMLLDGLQAMHGTSLTVPVRRRGWPDKDRIEQRFAEFAKRAS